MTNQDFDWTGAHTVKVYKISTGSMNDYDRAGTGSGTTGSRYGSVESLDATTEEFTLKKTALSHSQLTNWTLTRQRSSLRGASALARQQREVVIPEVDAYVYGVMAAGAGTKPAAVTLTADNIYDEITKATNTLDNAEVPDESRVIIVSPDVYRLMEEIKGYCHGNRH